MPKTCCICKVVASGEDVTFSYCGNCHSVLYCSKVCQRNDRKQHKKICKSLNAGDGAMQVRNPVHGGNAATMEERFNETKHSLKDDTKRFFKLFTESTFEGSETAARKMKEIVFRKTKNNRKCFLFHSLYLLIHTDSEKLIWPNSPLLVLLQFVGPNVSPGPDHEALPEGETKGTLLHQLACMADPRDYSTHENQLILGRQLIEHGANVNAVARPRGDTPLHFACRSGTTTNLDFIQLLLENGSDPNAQDHKGLTPLMHTLKLAPGAAKCLLEWPTTDVNIPAPSGVSFLGKVRETAAILSNTDLARFQFLFRQWCEIEEMLVERQAVDTGITAME